MATEEYSIGYDEGYQEGWNAAMDETIKQEQDEPVAWMNIIENDYKCLTANPIPNWTPLYTKPQPAQKPWVGLTEKERNDIEDWCEMMIGKPAFDVIEAKLKEKNT